MPVNFCGASLLKFKQSITQVVNEHHVQNAWRLSGEFWIMRGCRLWLRQEWRAWRPSRRASTLKTARDCGRGLELDLPRRGKAHRGNSKTLGSCSSPRGFSARAPRAARCTHRHTAPHHTRHSTRRNAPAHPSLSLSLSRGLRGGVDRVETREIRPMSMTPSALNIKSSLSPARAGCGTRGRGTDDGVLQQKRELVHVRGRRPRRSPRRRAPRGSCCIGLTPAPPHTDYCLLHLFATAVRDR